VKQARVCNAESKPVALGGQLRGWRGIAAALSSGALKSKELACEGWSVRWGA